MRIDVVIRQIDLLLLNRFPLGATKEELMEAGGLNSYSIQRALEYLQHEGEIMKVNAWLTSRKDLPDRAILYVKSNGKE